MNSLTPWTDVGHSHAVIAEVFFLSISNPFRLISMPKNSILDWWCDESHFNLYFSSFFPYIFDTITTKRWQVANKETLLQHSQALQPSWLSQSTWPSQLTQHYQDYDVNYDDRAAYSCSHSICFPIQCGLLWPALLSLLSFYQHSSITRLSLSGFPSFLHCAICLLYSLVITQQVMCVLFSNYSISFSIQ